MRIGKIASRMTVDTLSESRLVDLMCDEGTDKADPIVDGKRYRLILEIGGYHKNVITLAPALTMSYAEIDLALKLLDQLFARVAKA